MILMAISNDGVFHIEDTCSDKDITLNPPDAIRVRNALIKIYPPEKDAEKTRGLSPTYTHYLKT
jgi:hypothetical protein